MDLFLSPDERSKFENFFIPPIDYKPFSVYKSFSIPIEESKGSNISDKIAYLEKTAEEARKKFESFEESIKDFIEELKIADSNQKELKQKLDRFKDLPTDPNEIKKAIEVKVTEWI